MTKLEVAVELARGDFGLDVAHDFTLKGITALFGASGSGKSTLLRIIAGLERGAGGRIACNGEVWQDSKARSRFVAPWKRGVGLVFQDARLFDHLDVRGNLNYADRRSRRQGGEIAFADVVEALELGGLLDRRPVSLSGGERQRVAIARTLLSRPRLLLLDEPLAALDLRRKSEILPYIERLSERFGVPMIYVTHAIEEVVRLADRMVLMSEGGIVAAGGVGDILERLDLQPLTGRFEAGVVLEARVAEHDAAFSLTALELEGHRLVMPMLDLDVGSKVRVRVRARDVALATEVPRGISIRNVLPGHIAGIIEEGGTAFAEVLVDLGGVHLRSRITRRSVAELRLDAGAPVYALIKSISFDRRALGSRD